MLIRNSSFGMILNAWMNLDVDVIFAIRERRTVSSDVSGTRKAFYGSYW